MANNNLFLNDQKFTISAFGLKPSTVHLFYLGNQNKSANCVPVGGVMGGSLITDSSGTITFDFYFNSGISSNTAYSNAQKLINNILGSQSYTIKSTDGNSTATGTIHLSTAVSNTSLGLKKNVTIDSQGVRLFPGPNQGF